MPKYEILDAQGNVTNVIVADTEVIKSFGSYREVTEAAPQAARQPITKLEYMNRFTDAELKNIYALAKTSVDVEVWLEKFKMATEINLDDPRTVSGLQALEAAGILASGRAAEILS